MSAASNPYPAKTPAGRALRVDEAVVRNVLKVNPTLRKGRTTVEVKRALEAGEAFSAHQPLPGPKSAQDCAAPLVGSAGQLSDAFSLFLSGRMQRLDVALGTVAERRRQLEAEEEALRKEAIEQLVTFASMLDSNLLRTHGAAALGAHRDLLERFGLEVETVLNRTCGAAQ